MPTGLYDFGKYGRVAVEYMRLTKFDGIPIGIAAQALHVAHHLLFYSAGFTSDVNNDGMFLLTASCYYQTDNSRAEPFTDAPFVRLRFQSSQEDLFAYSRGIETTINFGQYLSGTVGVGVNVSPVVRLIGGIHHTEFVMPADQTVREINGFEGIISWGL